MCVLVGHLGISQVARAATTGVTLFFALSGFLITQLLLDEHALLGRIDLPRFYMRRTLRLMPALAVVLTVFGIYSVFDRTVSAPIVVPALYLSNFTLAAGRSLGIFDHLWSLAMEEQFYLLWPLALMMALRRSRMTGAIVAAAGAALSLAITVFLAATHRQGVDWTHIRFGPDARAHGLFFGCLIALLPAWSKSAVLRRMSLPALAVCVVASLQTDRSWWQYLFWRPMVAVSAVVLVVGLLDEHYWLARGAAWAPLVVTGRISYGLYLWHFPIYAVMQRHLSSLSLAARSSVLIAASVATAIVSYGVIERPFLRLKRRYTAARSG